MEKHELKPCPFCGSEAVLDDTIDCFGQVNITGHYVECTKCMASSQVFHEYGRTKEYCINRAVEFWNRRVEVE